jgi:hypothetical protein
MLGGSALDCESRFSLLVLRKSETFCFSGNQSGVALSMQRPTDPTMFPKGRPVSQHSRERTPEER